MSAPPWQLSLSSTRRGIYWMRYFLFAGGAAIALAVLQQAVIGTEHPVVGFWVGLGIGMILFRSQIRFALSPALFLTREAIHLGGRRSHLTIPWSSIAEIAQQSRTVMLQLLPDPSANLPRRELALRAQTFGVATSALYHLLHRRWIDPTERAALPTEADALRLASKVP